MKRFLPRFAIVVVLIGTALLLHSQGRMWWRPCEHLCPWSCQAWSSDNSQQLLGSFTFTHVLHGFVFCGLLALILPRVSALWRLSAAIAVEAFWEVAET